MSLADELKLLSADNKQREINEKLAKKKALEEAEIAKTKAEVEYCNTNFDDFKSQIVVILRNKFKDGKLELNDYSCTWNVKKMRDFLKHKFKDIIDWLMSEGFTVVINKNAVVDTGCEYDSEGGCIRGTEYDIYARQIIIRWDT
jgi:hypothetical protein